MAPSSRARLIALAMKLAAALLVMVLQAQLINAEIMSGAIEDLPDGLQLRRELSVQNFLAREDERRCVMEKTRNRGYYFVPVQDGEAGVTFDRCEIGV
jgi:hypothetical protein